MKRGHHWARGCLLGALIATGCKTRNDADASPPLQRHEPRRAAPDADPGPSRDAQPDGTPAPPAVTAAVDAGPAPTTPQGFEGARRRDLDGDGLDELERPLPYRLDRATEGRSHHGMLVAHGLPGGGFSDRDAFAQAATRAHCPERPAMPFTTGLGPGAEAFADLVDDAHRVLFHQGVCALAWGAPIEAVVAAYPGCAGGDGGIDAGALCRGGFDRDFTALRTLALPFRLQRVPTAPLTLLPPGQAPPVVPAPTLAPVSAAMRTRCAAADRAYLDTLGRLRREANARDETLYPNDEPLALCAAAGDAGWQLALAPPVGRGRGEDRAWDIVATLAPLGTMVAHPAPAGLTFTFHYSAMVDHHYSLGPAFDYDRDGRPEVAVFDTTYAHESDGENSGRLYTYDGRTVRPYGPAEGLAFERLEDIDHDGRPDLILPSPWTFSDNCGLNGVEHRGPTLAAHSLADGRFARDDAMAAAYLAEQCEGLRANLNSFDAEARLPHLIACARAFGREPSELIASVRRRPDAVGLPQVMQPASGGDACYSFEMAASRALIAPPFAPLVPGAWARLPVLAGRDGGAGP